MECVRLEAARADLEAGVGPGVRPVGRFWQRSWADWVSYWRRVQPYSWLGCRKDRPMLTVDDRTQRYGTVAAVDGLGLEVRQPNAGRAILINSGGAGRRVWYR